MALYADEECTDRVSEVEELYYANASATTVTFSGLDLGRTYYIAECDEDGVRILAGALADGTLYYVEFGDGNEVVVEDEDGNVTKYFENQYMTIPNGGYSIEAELTVTKKLLNAAGLALNSNETFYVGIFEDDSYTELSDRVDQNIIALDLGGDSEASSVVKVSVAPGETATLYVAEVDENGVPVGNNGSFPYEVSVDGAIVILNLETSMTATTTITNKKIEDEKTESESPAESETETESASVKTGDDTPVGMYFSLLLAAAAFLLAGGCYRKKRNY
ncbi:MAG: hypothetical protein LUF27_11955 [Lachnospiraceae bacterium]|nr:hypothetical protein [Lachnospiraceae bacterium]